MIGQNLVSSLEFIGLSKSSWVEYYIVKSLISHNQERLVKRSLALWSLSSPEIMKLIEFKNTISHPR